MSLNCRRGYVTERLSFPCQHAVVVVDCFVCRFKVLWSFKKQGNFFKCVCVCLCFILSFLFDLLTAFLLKMDRRVLYSVCALLFSMALSSSYGLVENDHHEDHVEMMLEPFERIKDLLNINSKGLTLLGVNNLIRKLFSRIHCNSPTAATGVSAPQPCGQSLVRYTCTNFLFFTV